MKELCRYACHLGTSFYWFVTMRVIGVQEDTHVPIILLYTKISIDFLVSLRCVFP